MLSLTHFVDDYLNNVETLVKEENIIDDVNEDVNENEDVNINDDEDEDEIESEIDDHIHISKKKSSQDDVNENTALMNHQQFDSFVKSTVISFLTRYNLGKITVDVGNGYKGAAKVNKNGEIETEVTFKEIL